MRITIDTEKKVVICPKTFWEDMRKTNEVLRSVGQNEIDHKERVKQYFEEAIQNDLVRPADVRKKIAQKKEGGIASAFSYATNIFFLFCCL